MRKKVKKFPTFFFDFFLVSGKSHSAEKCKRYYSSDFFKTNEVTFHYPWGPSGVFEHPFFCKIEKKIKRGPFGGIKKICEKNVSQSRNNLHKNLVKRWIRTHVLLLGRPQKSLINLHAKCR